MVTPPEMQSLLSSSYLAEDLQLRISRTKIGCLLGAVLMPIGGFLDNLLYPELTRDFIVIRIIVILLLGCIYLLLNTDLGKKHIKLLGVLLLITLNMAFCTMMLFSEGVTSRYHTALSLMILGAGILLPWTVMETLAVSIFTLIMYFSSCLLHGFIIGTFNEWDILFNNSYFVLLSGIIAVTASYFNSRARINDFELRQELDKRNRELEEMDRLKSRFFANISHELRTPLTLILAPIQDLLQNSSTFDEKINSLVKTAHSNALRLLRLVNDLLDVIKLEEGKMQYHGEPVEIDKFLAAMVDSMRHLAESHQIKLSKQLEAGGNIIIADSYLLERIFINLIGNAIKFTQPGGSITVVEQYEHPHVIIKISDTGIGISEADLPYIFDRFHQAGNSSTHRSQGTGLGLALVKELTEQMQGQISVTSKVGTGTTMQVNFPVSEHLYHTANDVDLSKSNPVVIINPITSKTARVITKPTPAITDPIVPAGTGHLVLIVDDEPDIRSYLIGTMENNYRVMEAVDGEQALKFAKVYKPDLMLLDLMLPKLDGLEVCKNLKDNNDTRHIKIMLLTARIDEEAKISALKNGADDFLTKPFSKVEVQTRLRNLLQTADLENKLRIHNKELEHALLTLKQTQSQLIHSEKINALGRLTAGLLHEINNPLNYSLTALQFVKHEPALKTDELLQEAFHDIDEGMNRIKTIIGELQIFAHPSETNKQEVFHFSEALTNAIRFTSKEIGDIRIIRNLQPGDEIFGSHGSIVQVLINLLSNASKAITAVRKPETGEITVTTEAQNGRLHIYLRDNGIGIKKDVIANIFDPFYTSRDVGEGMGLGLSICHTIVQNHGGKLTATSEPEKWTEFCFDLPLAGQIESSHEQIELHAVK